METGSTERRLIAEEALDQALSRIGEAQSVPDTGSFIGVTDLLLDGLLGANQRLLDRAANGLRSIDGLYRRRAQKDAKWERPAGRVEVLLALALSGSDRLVSEEEVGRIRIGGRSHELLRLLQQHDSLRGKDIAAAMGISDEQVSRLAGDLAETRLLARSKFGREVFWDITPRGEDALAVVDERAQAVQRRSAARVAEVSVGQIASVVSAEAHSSSEWDSESIRRSLERSGRIAERSQALFALLVQSRPEQIANSLDVWESFHRFSAPEPLELRLLPPFASSAEIERLTWEVLIEARPSFERVERAVWPAPLPRWDGWAVVPGRNNRRGIVFFEAKSQPEELKSLPFSVGTSADMEKLRPIMDHTRQELGAEREWGLWPEYADPAARLAFLYLLKELHIDAWWLNLYFVDPDQRMEKKMPASEDTWWGHIENVRETLDIVPRDRPQYRQGLRRYIKHDVVKVPDAGLELAGIPG